MARPTFDYHGSLACARSLWAFSNNARSTGAVRGAARDTALAAWLGPYGDNFRGRARAEDGQLISVSSQLQDDASAWGTAWGRAVNDMNDAVYAEAIEAQQTYIAREKAAEAREIAHVQHFLDMNYDPEIDGAPPTNYAAANAKWTHVSPGDAPAYVEKPRFFGPSGPPGFPTPGGFLAQYFRSGDELSISYISSIPGSPPA